MVKLVIVSASLELGHLSHQQCTTCHRRTLLLLASPHADGTGRAGRAASKSDHSSARSTADAGGTNSMACTVDASCTTGASSAGAVTSSRLSQKQCTIYRHDAHSWCITALRTALVTFYGLTVICGLTMRIPNSQLSTFYQKLLDLFDPCSMAPLGIQLCRNVFDAIFPHQITISSKKLLSSVHVSELLIRFGGAM